MGYNKKKKKKKRKRNIAHSLALAEEQVKTFLNARVSRDQEIGYRRTRETSVIPCLGPKRSKVVFYLKFV